jgi:hypothetical protein
MDEFADLDRLVSLGLEAGCPHDQIQNFLFARCALHARQLAASAAARLCDQPDGPLAIGFGGARGGGKTHWLLAQMGLDDCQRYPGLKCLLLRKVGKSNLENFGDFRKQLFARLPHKFSKSQGELVFPNGSLIRIDHFQSEKDLEKYIGLQYDVVGVEEATTLTHRKYLDILSCTRTSKPNWRPRIYSTTNPGGVGHRWYKATFIVPFRSNQEADTRFFPALVTDNKFLNPGYKKQLEQEVGWRLDSWRYGSWDFPAGQFFENFRHEIHVLKDFDENRGVEWFAAMDYGYSHHTVVLLGCVDCDGNLFVVDEHAERGWLPQQHVRAINSMLARHGLSDGGSASVPAGCHTLTGKVPKGYMPLVFPPGHVHRRPRSLDRFVAGIDVFNKRGTGVSIAAEYAQLGVALWPANMDRINGWAAILHGLGDAANGLAPKLFIHERCSRLIECLPNLQHDPNRAEDVLKDDADEHGLGGDDAADALRYLVATKPGKVWAAKLTGL